MHACMRGVHAGLAGLLGHGVQPKPAAAPQKSKTVDVPVLQPENKTVTVPVYTKPEVDTKPVEVCSLQTPSECAAIPAAMHAGGASARPVCM